MVGSKLTFHDLAHTQLLPCVVLLGHTKSKQTVSTAHGYVSDVLWIDLGCVRDRGLHYCVRSRMGRASRLFCSGFRFDLCWLRYARLRSILLAVPTAVCLQDDSWSLNPRLAPLSDVLRCRAACVRALKALPTTRHGCPCAHACV